MAETSNCKFIGKICNEKVFIDSKGNPDPDGYCIFHSRLLKEKSERFDKEFKMKFTEYDQDPNKIYDFRGYIFPNGFIISDYKTNEFKKDVNFSMANFHGRWTDFSGVKFHGQKTSFSMAEFHGEETDFKRAKFYGQETDFSGAVFHSEMTIFSMAKFHCDMTIFSMAKFQGKKISFERVEFKNNLLGLFDKGVLKKKHTFLRKNKYKIKNNNLVMFLDDKVSATYPILARTVKDSIYLNRYKEDHKITYFFWLLFADCGRSIIRWIPWSLLMIMGFAYKFYSMGSGAFRIAGNLKYGFETMFFYSVATFTSFGFGDITPQTKVAVQLVTAEVIIGYIMIGYLISILGVKLARRS